MHFHIAFEHLNLHLRPYLLILNETHEKKNWWECISITDQPQTQNSNVCWMGRYRFQVLFDMIFNRFCLMICFDEAQNVNFLSFESMKIIKNDHLLSTLRTITFASIIQIFWNEEQNTWRIDCNFLGFVFGYNILFARIGFACHTSEYGHLIVDQVDWYRFNSVQFLWPSQSLVEFFYLGKIALL